MTTRRTVLAMLGVGMVASPWATRAQVPAQLYRIGVLEFLPVAQNAANFSALKQGLTDGGYVEGRNLAITYLSANADPQRLPALAAELVKAAPDVIVTRGVPATLAAKHVTTTIPIVMTAGTDPMLVVDSLAHPGGNVTGFGTFVGELQAKRVELLKELDPNIARMAFFANTAVGEGARQVDEVKAAAGSRGIAVQIFEVLRVEQVPDVLAAVAAAGQDALLVATPAFRLARRLVADFAAAHRLPAIYSDREYAAAGGLISYGVSYPSLYRRAGFYAAKILKGARAADLPVEMPSELELVLNMKAARAAQITIPSSLLARADEVIE